MSRPKILSDKDVLEMALALMHQRGPEALTFASLAEAGGLSAATLVQRFGNKARLRQSTLLHAWDRLDGKTAQLAGTVPKTAKGAIALLAGLSEDYGGIDSYAEGLLMLREDIRDPVLRARGAAWKRQLCGALDDCFATYPAIPEGIGMLMASQWQGALLWWSFDPRQNVERFVAASLEDFLQLLALSGVIPAVEQDG